MTRADINPLVGRHFVSKRGHVCRVSRVEDGAIRIDWEGTETAADVEECNAWVRSILGGPLALTVCTDPEKEEETLEAWRRDNRFTAEMAIISFAAVARSAILSFFTPNSCIAASRITVEVLRRFGVTAEAVPVAMVVESKARALAFVSGVTRAGATELRPFGPDSWPGHLVVIAQGFGKRRYLIDPSFDQCSMPDHGVPVSPCVLVVPIEQHGIPAQNIAADMVLETDTGEALHVMYRPLRDQSYKDAPAWETDHLQQVIYMICERMTKRADAAAAAQG